MLRRRWKVTNLATFWALEHHCQLLKLFGSLSYEQQTVHLLRHLTWMIPTSSLSHLPHCSCCVRHWFRWNWLPRYSCCCDLLPCRPSPSADYPLSSLIPHASRNSQCNLSTSCPPSPLTRPRTSSPPTCRMVCFSRTCHRHPPRVSWHLGAWACSIGGWVQWSHGWAPRNHGGTWRWTRRLPFNAQSDWWGSSLQSEGWGSGLLTNERSGKPEARTGWSERTPKMLLFYLILPDLSSGWQSSDMIARNTLPWKRWAVSVLKEIRPRLFPKAYCIETGVILHSRGSRRFLRTPCELWKRWWL